MSVPLLTNAEDFCRKMISLPGNDGGFVHRPMGDVEFERTVGSPKIYVMTMLWTPYLKVGISTNVMSRRRALEGPMDIEIRHVRQVGCPDAALRIEESAHLSLAEFRHRNEWFVTSVAHAIFAVNFAAQNLGVGK